MPLPPQIDVNGDWDDVLLRLYASFCATFKSEVPIHFNGKSVVFDRRKIDSPYEEGFWHIISRGKGDDRLPDFPRASRISWLASMLDGSAPNLSCWSYVEGSGATRFYLWLEAEGYVVILEEGTHVVSLVTAFSVDQEWTARGLRKKRGNGLPL